MFADTWLARLQVSHATTTIIREKKSLNEIRRKCNLVLYLLIIIIDDSVFGCVLVLFVFKYAEV